MTEIIHYSPEMICNNADKLKDVPGIENFINFTKSAGGTAYSSGPIDRTNIIKIPFKTKITKPMPSLDLEFSKTYEDCVFERIKELLQISETTGKKFRLFYSGGLDSTCILGAFISYLGLEKTASLVELFCSKESIYENPWLWERYIRPGNFKLLSSHEHSFRWHDNVIYIQGDLNEHLFDPASAHAGWKRFASIHGYDHSFSLDKLVEWKVWASNNTVKKETIQIWAEFINKLCSNAPLPITNMNLVSWYQGFNLSFCANHVRVALQSKDRQLPENFIDGKIIQFFASDDFQRWSLKRHFQNPDNLNTEYKKECKELVLKLIDIPEYTTKNKFPSLPRIWSKRPTGCFIDSNYVVHTDPTDFLDFIEPNNSFV
jgi:hypothetical protein